MEKWLQKVVRLLTLFWLNALVLVGVVPGFGQSTAPLSYRNPIIPGFYPDPSICRVGADYYLVNSSFEYFPGIPIWHSRDLVHWQQIGNVLNRASQLNLKGCQPYNGIYAPTIRFHQGIYYVIATLVGGGQVYKNFYVTATDPVGPWSDPIFYDQHGIDPSLFFDDDGRCYFLSNRATKSNDPRAIYQSEINLKTGARISEIKEIWKGSGGSYVEGPHMYKKEGWYYLLTAEGGTSTGHMVSIARSKQVWGPFESNPANPILTNRMAYDALKGAGHADLVQAVDSSWWMVHLAFRPKVDGIHFLGRETCLTPVEWPRNTWPIVNANGTATEKNVKHPPGYIPGSEQPFSGLQNTEFDRPLGFEWMHLRNPDSSHYSLSARPGWLQLKGSPFTLSQWDSPTLIARRQQHFNFVVSTRVDFSPGGPQEEAGLTLFMRDRFHYDFYIANEGMNRWIYLRYTLDSLQQVLAKQLLPKGEIELEVKGDRYNYVFYCTSKEGVKKQVGLLNTRFLGTEVAGGYNGVVIGLYATGNGSMSQTPAYFDFFHYKSLDHP
jgi:alpha-N-arabinofuranosidase